MDGAWSAEKAEVGLAVVEVLPSVAVERPRERMFSAGEAALTDVQLLTAIIGTGTKGKPAEQLAQALFDSYAGDLVSLSRAEVMDLAEHRGLGKAKACAVAAAFELGRRVALGAPRSPVLKTSADVYAWCGPRLGKLRHEVFHVLCLDTRHRLVRDARIAEGGLTSLSLTPREVFAPAIREAASAVVLVHNHPSGDPEPSEDDLVLTSRLKQAGSVLGIRVLDHVVVGSQRYLSMVDEGQFARL